MRLKLQYGTSSSVVTLTDTSTLHDLRHKISQEFNDANLVLSVLRVGFPPAEISSDVPGETTLNSIGITSGFLVNVSEVKPDTQAKSNNSIDYTSHVPHTANKGINSSTVAPNYYGKWQCPACTYANDGLRTICEICETARPSNETSNSAIKMKRYEVDSDNSCLFRSFSHLACNDTVSVQQLRKTVAEFVDAHQDKYNEAILEKSVDTYKSWIQKNTSWGGAIELGILSQIYQVEICAFDISSTRAIWFGDGCGYAKRIYLLFDGIHYDGIVSEDGHTTQFDPTNESTLMAAQTIAKQANERRQFTDTSRFSLRCNTCGKGLTGQKEAIQHAEETSHAGFSEY